MPGLKPVTRIARLEQRSRKLLRQIQHAQSIYDVDRLQMAGGHVQAAIRDLEIAKIGAASHASWRRVS